MDAKELAAWVIAILVALPFACILGTATYYRLRYRAGIAWQKHFDKGLFQ